MLTSRQTSLSLALLGVLLEKYMETERSILHLCADAGDWNLQDWKMTE